MKKIETPLKDLWVIEVPVFGDHRGYFMESWNQQLFEGLGIQADFVQDNVSVSQKGVLRGLHFQKPPMAQGKLVRVIKGAVLDVAVDLRKNSPSYGRHYSVELNGKNKLAMWIPPGFAHGFETLEDDTIFSYKCTQFYAPETEGCLLWNDADLGIDWKELHPKLSAKDMKGERFESFKSPF